MMVSMIAAMTPGRVIGGPGGGIPWNLPRDRTHFRAYTGGKWILVGRRTYGEMTGWFTEHSPLVLTRNPKFRPTHPAHRVVNSLPGAIDLARRNGAAELVVCGGASVYAAALPFADRLVLTTVDAIFGGEAHFPPLPSDSRWRTVYRELWPADEENSLDADLTILERSSYAPPNP